MAARHLFFPLFSERIVLFYKTDDLLLNKKNKTDDIISLWSLIYTAFYSF